jgi:chromosome segregation ATPase
MKKIFRNKFSQNSKTIETKIQQLKTEIQELEQELGGQEFFYRLLENDISVELKNKIREKQIEIENLKQKLSPEPTDRPKNLNELKKEKQNQPRQEKELLTETEQQAKLIQKPNEEKPPEINSALAKTKSLETREKELPEKLPTWESWPTQLNQIKKENSNLIHTNFELQKQVAKNIHYFQDQISSKDKEIEEVKASLTHLRSEKDNLTKQKQQLLTEKNQKIEELQTQI